jgi:hypothetical protein
MQVQVVDKLDGVDGIMGLDFLEKHRGVLDVGNGTLHLWGREIQLLGRLKELSGGPSFSFPADKQSEDERRKGINVSESKEYSVCLGEEIRVPPNSGRLMRITVDACAGTGSYLVEPAFDSVENCYVARGLCTIDDKKSVTLQVTNFGREEVILRKGTRLGVATKLEPSEVGAGRTQGKIIRTIASANSGGMFREKLAHLGVGEREALLPLLEEFGDLFTEKDRLPVTALTSHRINTGNAPPVYRRPYRVPHHLKPVVESSVNEQLEAGIIVHSESPWASPIVVVPKKSADGKPAYRFCVDFRALNAVTVPDVYPIPNVVESLDYLGNSRFFSTLDLTSGYHQIPMHKDDQEKTAFNVDSGHYHYTRMPFGLRNAPATFQRMMDGLLRGLKPVQCLVYLDDVIIFSATIEEHVVRLRSVLERLRNGGLTLKFEKCKFAEEKVNYLGHVISKHGVQPDPGKISAVREFPTPTSVKELQSFLGLSNYYRRFVVGYAEIARPLTKLLRKGAVFNWDGDCVEAFEKLKDALTHSPVLAYPDFDKPFIISTDASNFAIGAVLSQETDGEEHPIAYASRQLNSAEINYTVTEKELCSVVFAVAQYRCYVYGRKFKIVSDHAALKWLFGLRDPSSRLMRWTLKLSEYDYEVVHKPGVLHKNADGLSRKVRRIECTPIVDMKSAQEGDIECAEWAGKAGFEVVDGILFKISPRGRAIVVPERVRNEILRQCHDYALAGHLGVRSTKARVAAQYWWPHLGRDCEAYVKNCVSCNRRSPYGKCKTRYKPYRPPTGPSIL